MTGYLLDTNIISEAAPGRVGRHDSVVQWLETRTDQLFLSVVTVAEIEAGIALAGNRAAHRKAARLADWLQVVVQLYGRRILPFDLAAARVAGRLSVRSRMTGSAPGFADIAIAATANHRGLVLLTRNIRHFESLGIAVTDPFLQLPS